jgi:hypothetical protein
LTVYFSLVIERESVSTTIVRAMCDVNRKVESVTFVRDEQNVVSLWTADDPPLSSWSCMSKIRSS